MLMRALYEASATVSFGLTLMKRVTPSSKLNATW